MSDVIDLAKWKRERQRNVEGRKPLYVSHLTGKVTANPPDELEREEFKNRLEQIRESNRRIQELMKLLKQMSTEKSNVDDSTR